MTGPPATAHEVFGDRLERAVQFAGRLAGAGVQRGLIGPREVPRLWDRHLLNCAVLSDLVPSGARVVDVGTGAGLPGLVLAIRRPDLRVDLVEPMLRRTTFLSEAVAELDLGDSVRVVRGRADDAAVHEAVAPTDWITARAVAPLDRLAGWCLPLLGPKGSVLAMKGRSVDAEVTQLRAARRDVSVQVVEVGADVVSPPVRVAVLTATRGTRTGGRR